jgi:hypothetical protein
VRVLACVVNGLGLYITAVKRRRRLIPIPWMRTQTQKPFPFLSVSSNSFKYCTMHTNTRLCNKVGLLDSYWSWPPSVPFVQDNQYYRHVISRVPFSNRFVS